MLMSNAVILAPRAAKKMHPSRPKFPPAPVMMMCLFLNRGSRFAGIDDIMLCFVELYEWGVE